MNRCNICESEKVHHTYESGRMVCLECFEFVQKTVNQIVFLSNK